MTVWIRESRPSLSSNIRKPTGRRDDEDDPILTENALNLLISDIRHRVHVDNENGLFLPPDLLALCDWNMDDLMFLARHARAEDVNAL
jgi:hypothetical protein